MKRLHIKNGRLIDPATDLDGIADLYIDAGKIVSTSDKPDGFDADTTIDATGHAIIPGIIDLCARLREPGDEYKADIKSETTAAASAGITRLCCPPDTQPVIDEPAVIDLINHKATDSAQSKISALDALTTGLRGEFLSEMFALKQAGCVGVSNARHPIHNSLVLKRAYAYAANCGLTVFIEPDATAIMTLRKIFRPDDNGLLDCLLLNNPPWCRLLNRNNDHITHMSVATLASNRRLLIRPG